MTQKARKEKVGRILTSQDRVSCLREQSLAVKCGFFAAWGQLCRSLRGNNGTGQASVKTKSELTFDKSRVE